MEDGRPVGRRIVLGLLGAGVVGVLTGRRLSDAGSWLLDRVENRGLVGALVPAGQGFRYYSVTGTQPEIAPTAYRLRVIGLVEHPLELTLADLEAMPRTELVRDFQCVTGWRVPGVHWSGVALPDVLERASPRAEARAVRFFSYDGTYTESLTLSQAQRRDILVATRMLGDRVSSAHGGPVRLYVAPMYGYKSVKWLAGIDVVRQAVPGYWERRGYDADAWVGRSNGRPDVPTG